MNAKQGNAYLREYKKEAPYLEKDDDLEVYDPKLDIDDNEPAYAYALGNKPPPRPNWLTGSVDTSDLTGRKRSWNPLSRFTRKNKMQRVPPQVLEPIKNVENLSDTESETDSDDYKDDDDGSLEDIYDEVRADPVVSQVPVQVAKKPGFFSNLFGKKSTQGLGSSSGLGQDNNVTQKKSWYKFWGGLSNGGVSKRGTQKIRKIRRTRRLKRNGKKMIASRRGK
jgi:hypothetical protein